MMRALRIVLVLDAALLFVLGLLLIFVPARVELAFQFKDLPPAVSFILSLWGCVLATMAFGYCIASQDPARHVVWIQIGIARGVLECVVGLAYLAQGIVTLEQSGFGIVAAGLLALAYIVLYPRPRVSPNLPVSHESAP